MVWSTSPSRRNDPLRRPGPMHLLRPASIGRARLRPDCPLPSCCGSSASRKPRDLSAPAGAMVAAPGPLRLQRTQGGPISCLPLHAVGSAQELLRPHCIPHRLRNHICIRILVGQPNTPGHVVRRHLDDHLHDRQRFVRFSVGRQRLRRQLIGQRGAVGLSPA